jgi:hypothetical protein
LSLYVVISGALYMSHPEMGWIHPKIITTISLFVATLIFATSLFLYNKRDKVNEGRHSVSHVSPVSVRSFFPIEGERLMSQRDQTDDILRFSILSQQQWDN